MNRVGFAVAVASLWACRPGAAPEQVHRPATPRTAHSTASLAPRAAHATTSLAHATTSTVADGETEFDSYASRGDDLDGWRLALARNATRVRIVLKPNLTSGTPVELEGAVAGQAGQWHIDAHTSTSKGVLSLDAVVDAAGKLRGKLRMQATRVVIELERRTSPADSEETWQENFGGTLGAAQRLRLSWEQSGLRAKATLSRLGGTRRTFEGTLERQSGRFELKEHNDGKNRLRGIFMGGPGGGGIGEWVHDGTVEPLSLDRFYPTYPTITALRSGGRVVPAERFHRGFPDCPSSDDVFPRFEGVAAERLLNAELEKTVQPLVDCIDRTDASFLGSLWSGSTYSVTASRAQWVGLAFEWNSYMGGAHGGFMEGCAVANVQNGKVVHLNQELAPTSFEKLSVLVRKSILKAAPGKSLQDLGFHTDDLHIGASREMCVVEDRGALFLEVVYQNDLDDAGIFHFVNVRPRLAAASVRPFFSPGSLGALVFR